METHFDRQGVIQDDQDLQKGETARGLTVIPLPYYRHFLVAHTISLTVGT